MKIGISWCKDRQLSIKNIHSVGEGGGIVAESGRRQTIHLTIRLAAAFFSAVVYNTLPFTALLRYRSAAPLFRER